MHQKIKQFQIGGDSIFTQIRSIFCSDEVKVRSCNDDLSQPIIYHVIFINMTGKDTINLKSFYNEQGQIPILVLEHYCNKPFYFKDISLHLQKIAAYLQVLMYAFFYDLPVLLSDKDLQTQCKLLTYSGIVILNKND